jgi:hypothetical protein
MATHIFCIPDKTLLMNWLIVFCIYCVSGDVCSCQIYQFVTLLSCNSPPPSPWLYSPMQALAASMKISISLQLLDLGQLVGLLGRVISLSQCLYLYTNTKHPCSEWDLNPRSQRPLSEDSSGLRLLSYHDWPVITYLLLIVKMKE